ncbi:MAG: restriction endonuclease subunit S [Burkholderiales bacterium]|nr:restriction endonuclease subunit S [Burkholderiales bacterium]
MTQVPQGYKQTKVGIIPDGWEVAPIQEKFNFVKTYSNSRSELSETGEISYIHYGDIHLHHKFYIDFGVFELPKIELSKLPNEVMFVQNGDLVIADVSEDYADIGKSAEIKNLTSKAVSGLHTFLLRDKSNTFVDGYKGYLLYNEIVAKKIKKIATGISVLGISKANLSNLEIPIPPIKEQEKIAAILSTWDDAITKQKQLINEKQIFKKGIMQQIFSQKIRFKDDDGNDYPAWQTKKLGDVGKVSMCKRVLKDETLPIGEIPFFKIGTFGGKADAYITKELYQKNITQYSFPKVGDILISASGTIGRTVVYNGKPSYFQDSNIVWVSNNEELIQNRLLYFYYKMIKWNTEDTTIARLYNDNLKAISINIPYNEEQTRIADFLTSIDDEIIKQTEVLEQLKLQKQSLMQKLLTGHVRALY